MNIIKVSLAFLFFLTTISFAGNIEEGPIYLNNQHYKLGKDELSDGSSIGENYEIRFWMKSNFGESMSNAELNKIAKEKANEIKKLGNTHMGDKWFWHNVKDNQYLIIGYSDATNSQHSYAIIKKRYNDWIYRCSGDEHWAKVESGDSATCRLKKGYDLIKFQFHNPDRKDRWDRNDIMYRFAIFNR